MDENSTFAIVDLETTAPFKEDGHIIQIGISFVKKWKIINNFQTMVNPGVKIPNQIVDLTGIKNEDVQDAPYFEDLAAMIHDQLSEAVFVAHNVRYDFPYLNGEFTRIKMHRLRVEYVDTVQLAQIIFPTIPSYKLDELVQHLGIKLPRHHRADQDAHATAQLFLKIHEQIDQLPVQTLATLLDHSASLLGNTEKIFSFAKGQAQTVHHDPFAFKTPTVLPATKKQLLDWISDKKQFSNKKVLPSPILRPRQETFANIFQSKIANKKINAYSVFSRPRFGKSNAYLLLADQLAEKSARVLIIEENVQRRKLLFQKSQMMLAAHKDRFAIPITRKDFIDLDKFNESLSIEESPTRQLAKLRILTWLAETKTGYLHELVNGFPEQLFSLFTDQNPATDFDYYKQAVKVYNFPAIGITDLDSFFVTEREFSKNYDLFIFDVGKGFSDLLDHDLNFSNQSIFFTQAEEYLKNWYSMRSFSNFESLLASLNN